MITRDNIKVAKVTMFKDKNKFLGLIPMSLSLNETYREVVVIDDLVIDIKTSTIIEPLKNSDTQLFNYYYTNIINLQYVSDIDFKAGVEAYKEYTDQIKRRAKIINIQNIKNKKNKRRCN